MRRSTEGQLMSLISLGDGSTLTLDFTTGVLDPRLTFSRTSDATFINSSGLVQWADANHVQNSTMLNNTGTRWTQVTSGGTVTINGDGTVRFNGTGGRATWLQSISSLASGLPMTFSFRVTSFTNTNLRTTDLFNAGTGFTGQSYFYTDTTGTTHTLTAFESLPKSGTNGVGTYSVTATTNATSANIIFGSDCNGVGSRSGDVTITEPQLQYGTVVPRRVYVPNSSIIAAKWDSARFDHDPTTRAPRGLLIEGTATNIATNSNLQAAWLGGSNTTVTANTNEVTSPDGTNNAAKIALTNTGYCSRFESITGLANATTYTFSYWIRGTAGNQQRVYSVTQGTDLVTQSNLTYTSTGWTRVQITFTSGAVNNNVYIYVASRPSGTVNDVLYVYGCQLEAGNGASSLIPTGASTGQRLADSCVMTGTNFSSWFAGATEGVLYAELERPRSQSGNPLHDFAAVGTRYSSGSAFVLYVGNTNYYPTVLLWPTGGALFPGGIASVIPLVSKQAGKWFGGNDATNFANGVQGTTSAGSGTLTPAMLSIGANSATGTEATRDWLNACVRRVKFWPVALPDSQIIALTT
jgi:hypothetical protein